MHSLVDYAWISNTPICTVNNAIDYTWIGKKLKLQYP